MPPDGGTAGECARLPSDGGAAGEHPCLPSDVGAAGKKELACPLTAELLEIVSLAL